MADTHFAACIYCKIAILDNPDSIQPLCSLTDYFKFLFIGKEAPLVYIHTHSHHHFIKHGKSSLENIQMACCKGVK